MAKRRDTERLRSEVEELFADLWQLPRFVHARTGFRPPVDYFVSASGQQLVVVVELAGSIRSSSRSRSRAASSSSPANAACASARRVASTT